MVDFPLQNKHIHNTHHHKTVKSNTLDARTLENMPYDQAIKIIHKHDPHAVVYSSPPETKEQSVSQSYMSDHVYLKDYIPKNIKKSIETPGTYAHAFVHYGPSVFIGSGMFFIVLFFIYALVKASKKTIRYRQTHSKLVEKAPLYVEKPNLHYDVRTHYPEQVVPQYRVKLKDGRNKVPDTIDGLNLYRNTKKRLKIQRKNTCQCCGLVFDHHEFHHLNDNHLDHRPENLAMLCRYCHSHYHCDVMFKEGGYSCLLPDFKMAEIAHIQQYRDYVRHKIKYELYDDVDVDLKKEKILSERIDVGLKKRADLVMSMIRSDKPIHSLCEIDQRIQEGAVLKLSKKDMTYLARFQKIRRYLKVAYPEKSALDSSTNSKKETYEETSYQFRNANIVSFPRNSLETFISRLNETPKLPQDVLDMIPNRTYTKKSKRK